MTITSLVKEATFSGNGVTTVFPIVFPFLVDSDLAVTLVNASGIPTLQLLTTQYTVSGAGDPGGGSVTMLVAPASGTSLVVERVVAETQETDLQNQGAYYAETIEAALDKLTMLAQQNVSETELAAAIATAIAGLTVGTYNPVIATGTTTARSLQDRAADEISPENYGAIGNGVADDSAAVQAAITAGAQGEVVFHHAQYKITVPLTLAGCNTVWRAAGQFGTKLFWAAASPGTMLTITGGNSIKFQNIFLDAYPGSGNYYRVGDVAINTSAVITGDNLYIRGFEKLVVYNGGFYHKFNNCRFEMADICFPLWNANNLTFDKCKALRFNKFITLSGGQGPVYIYGTSFEQWCQSVVSTTGGLRPSIVSIGNYFENAPVTAADTFGLATPFYSAGEVYVGVGDVLSLGDLISANGILRFIDSATLAIQNIFMRGHVICTLGATSSWMDHLIIWGSAVNVDIKNRLNTTLTPVGSPPYTFDECSSPMPTGQLPNYAPQLYLGDRPMMKATVNMNSTADQAIILPSANWIPTAIVVTNASVSLTTAAGGIYTAAAKGGTALVTAGQVYSALTANTKQVALTLANTDRQTVGTIYLSLTTPQGGAATADIYIYGRPL